MLKDCDSCCERARLMIEVRDRCNGRVTIINLHRKKLNETDTEVIRITRSNTFNSHFTISGSVSIQ